MSGAPELPPAPDVAGTSLDGTEPYVITREQNAALCRSTGVQPAADGTAHPIYYYIATQVAMGKTVAGVCATCEFDVEDGPMMGSSGVVFAAPLRVVCPTALPARFSGWCANAAASWA